MNAYLKALRAPFLTGSLVPVIIGAALAIKESEFVFSYFLVSLIGVAGLHLGANLINDYYDAGGSDPINLRMTPFSGGSRVIQNGEIKPGTVLAMRHTLWAATYCSTLSRMKPKYFSTGRRATSGLLAGLVVQTSPPTFHPGSEQG